MMWHTKFVLALACAGASMLALAAPAEKNQAIKNADTAPMGAPFDNSGVAPLFPQLGLNCRGSTLCAGCSSLDNVLNKVLKIDDGKKFKNGQQIACGTCPMFGKEALCVFAQNMEKDETVRASVVKEKLARLKDHGCRGCGSCPIHPGNNVNTGQITVNFVRKICGNGICGDVQVDDDEVPAVARAAVEPTAVEVDTLVPQPTTPSTAIMRRALGLNCRGSIMCGDPICRADVSLDTIIRHVDTLPDDIVYKNNEHIACDSCPIVGQPTRGICVFARNMKDGERVTGAVVKEKVHRLKRHGCKACGGCPIHPGNNRDTGEIVVDFVVWGCRDDSGPCIAGELPNPS